MSVVFNPFTGELDIVGASGGSPGGSDMQVQFNDNGAFAGDAGLTYDKVSGLLGVKQNINFQVLPNSDPHSINSNSQTNPDTAGNGINFTLGDGLGTGDGGGMTINVGNGGDDGDGGDFAVIAGAGGVTSGDGGDVTISSGTGQGTGKAGDMLFATGNPGSGAAGLIQFRNGNGGSIGILDFLGLASVQTFTFPNETGTIAMKAVGVTDTFTTVDLKTVTVVDGIIVSIA